jgi:hypothetical protein
MSLGMQPQNERYFTLFQLGWLERRRERGRSHGVRRRAARPKHEPGITHHYNTMATPTTLNSACADVVLAPRPERSALGGNVSILAASNRLSPFVEPITE